MKNKIKNYLKQNKVNIIIFVIIFTITCVIFFPFLMGHYATDTYDLNNVGYGKYAKENFFCGGRIFSGICAIISNGIRIPIKLSVEIMLLMALIISNLAVIIIKKII